MIIIPEYVAMLRANPSDKTLLNKIKFQLIDAEKHSWEGNKDQHAGFRQEVTRQLYQHFSNDDRALIITLLQEEIKNCHFLKNSNDNLCRLLFMLYTLKNAEDLPLMYDAKFKLGYNATLNIDINLLFGLGNEVILAHDESLQRYLDYNEILEAEVFYQQQKSYWDKDLQEKPVPEKMSPVQEEEDEQLRFFFDKGDVLTFKFSDQKMGGLVVAERFETFDDADYIVYPTNFHEATLQPPLENLHIYGRRIKSLNMGNPFEQSIKTAEDGNSLEKSHKTMLVSITIAHSVLAHFQARLTPIASLPQVVYKGTHHLARVTSWAELEMHLNNLVQGNYPTFEVVNIDGFLQD
ncbi:hypothetical protein [uncultured Microscilla sp.]|uniref:hypothetical protein n=1 Tax=uncultured Microscilla sp. TaxID=432653 RepID=UPI0026344635|nr:hypothetical protein [uncultured Microscilla sp.]